MSPYLDALSENIPEPLRRDLDQLKAKCQDSSILEILIRFISGGDCPQGSAAQNDWLQRQQSFSQKVSLMGVSSSQKRPREETDEGSGHSSAKRSKVSSEEVEDDEPLFTLHSISVTSPVRKKVNVSIHGHSIKFTNPTTKSVESSIPLNDIKRVFLLPTRGKSKPHYTVALLTSDFSNTGRGKAAATATNTLQITFGVDATPSPTFTTTSRLDSPIQHPKGSSILDSLNTFLSHLPKTALPVMEPSLNVHTNAAGSSGVDAYRSAKPGTVWFLAQGILWDAKPVEFWPLDDLVSSKGGGLRLLSATGRTCSVIVRRKLPKSEEDESEDENDVDGVDTDFAMVEGKEQDGITQWVKKYGPMFGRKIESTKADSEGKGKEVVANAPLDLSSNPRAEAESDLEDDDYAGSDESEDLSGTSEDDSSEDGEGEEDAEGSASAGSDDESGDEEEEFAPKNHPLLRPGAMPRMSRAAIDAVVGMVESDLLGTTTQTAGGSAEDEEDELDEL